MPVRRSIIRSGSAVRTAALSPGVRQSKQRYEIRILGPASTEIPERRQDATSTTLPYLEGGSAYRPMVTVCALVESTMLAARSNLPDRYLR